MVAETDLFANGWKVATVAVVAGLVVGAVVIGAVRSAVRARRLERDRRSGGWSPYGD